MKLTNSPGATVGHLGQRMHRPVAGLEGQVQSARLYGGSHTDIVIPPSTRIFWPVM